MATIGIFDSGEGGLSVLREITRLLPDDKYIYFLTMRIARMGKSLRSTFRRGPV